MNGTIYDLFAIPHEPLGLGKLRQSLLAEASGKTLEIGAGTGLNFKHYPEGTQLIAIEPHDSMREKALLRAGKLPGIVVDRHEAESLPYPDESLDTVVATLALCSANDPQAALRETYRVLKPQGKLLIMEHFRKESFPMGLLLDLLTPAWKWISGGCRLNSRLPRFLAAVPFKVERHENLWGGCGGLWVLKK